MSTVPATQAISQRPTMDSAGIKHGVIMRFPFESRGGQLWLPWFPDPAPFLPKPCHPMRAERPTDKRSVDRYWPRCNQTSGRIACGLSRANQPYSWFATSLKVCDALLPIEVIAPKQTTTIRASITAYSTAVGPSSDFRKRCTFKAKFFMASLQMRDHPETGHNEKQKT